MSATISTLSVIFVLWRFGLSLSLTFLISKKSTENDRLEKITEKKFTMIMNESFPSKVRGAPGKEGSAAISHWHGAGQHEASLNGDFSAQALQAQVRVLLC